MHKARILALSGMLWMALTGALFSQTLGEALTNGTVSAQLRLSLEQADVTDNETDTATALNLRTRLGYRTGPFADMAAFLQFQDVSAIVRDYAPLDRDFDTIADPESASVHQAYLEYSGAPRTQIRLGRQEVALDDHRLIGNVDWRQQGQSFDAITITNRSLEDLTLFVGAIGRVLTPAGTFLDLDRLLLLQADWRGIEGHLIGLRGYWLDSPGGTDADRDSATYGARITGELPAAEYALDHHQQVKYADATANGGSMTNAFAAAKFAGFRFGLGYSVITGARGGDHAFDTLFSTAHAHNGWADQFISTNGGGLTNGLKDAYALVGGNHVVRWELAYHQFDQETRSEAYGREVDLLATMPLAGNLTGLLKAALYTADSANTSGAAATDKSVFWARLDYKF
jgi:hypothetical protein